MSGILFGTYSFRSLCFRLGHNVKKFDRYNMQIFLSKNLWMFVLVEIVNTWWRSAALLIIHLYIGIGRKEGYELCSGYCNNSYRDIGTCYCQNRRSGFESIVQSV